MLLLLCFIPLAVSQDAATASDLSSSVQAPQDWVMGRQVNSTFEYDINDPHVPIDTSLVIDESGSMSGVLEDAKEGAKNYIDNTKTSEGDKNAVVEFESSASTIQSLTSSKQDAKDAVDTISAGGGTDLPAGVSEGHDSLKSGSNPEQVMIVLADGGGGDPGTEADAARDDGIEIHGIMYGSGASTSEFESLTNADNCETNSAENDDGDKCWYAEAGTIDAVYNSIIESYEVETNASLRMRMRDFVYPDDSYDEYNDYFGSNQEFVRNYYDVEDGSYERNFQWRPTEHGTDKKVLLGDSILQLNSSEGVDEYDFTNESSRDIKYVDFNVTNASITRRGETVHVDFTVINEGDTASLLREIWVADGLGSGANYESFDLNSLDPGENRTFNLEIDGSSSVFGDEEDIYVRADPSGYWGSQPQGEGEVLEPNEGNNIVNLGYPPKILNIDPEPTDDVEWGDTIKPEFTYKHQDPAEVEGVYNYTNQSTLIDEEENMESRTESGNVVLETEKEYFIDVAERWYNFTVKVEDDRGAESVDTASYYVENPQPRATALNPEDGGQVTNFPVDLVTRVDDENSEYHNRNLTVTLYDHQGNYLEDFEVEPGNTASYEWDIPDALETRYTWTVEKEDKWDKINTTFSFTKIVGRSYRSDLSVDLNYSSIVLNAGDSRLTELTITNNVENDKNLTVNLTGIKSEFLDGDTQKTLPDFEGQSSRSYTLRINPDEPTDEDLVVVVRNNDLGIETRETISVSTLSSTGEANEVPGIGLIQVIFLIAVSTVLYSVRL